MQIFSQGNRSVSFVLHHRVLLVVVERERRKNGERSGGELCRHYVDGDGGDVQRQILRQQAGTRRSEDRGHRLSGRPPALREVCSFDLIARLISI